MESISITLTAALGYILKGAAQSKMPEGAKEEILSNFWNWIKPFFIKEVPRMEEKPSAPETEINTQEQLLLMIKDEAFFNELAAHVSELREAGIKEKHIVMADIERVKKIRIGDKAYSPTDFYERKTMAEGNITDAE